MSVESHSGSYIGSVDSPPNSLQDERKTVHTIPGPLPFRHSVRAEKSQQIKIVHRKTQSCNATINDSLLDFIKSRKKIEKRNATRWGMENAVFSNDERESRFSLNSEESKELTPFRMNWEQECQKLERQLRGMEHARDIQIGEHERTEQKLKQSLIVVQTEKHNMQQELENSWSFIRDMQSKVRIMHDEMHDLAVENSVLRSNMSRPHVNSGWNVEEYESVSKEDVLKILEEHNKELQVKNSQINSLSSERRKLVSDKLQLKKDIEKLNTELKISREEVIKKKQMIRQANIKWEESYNENTILAQQIAADDLEITRLNALCSQLSSRVEDLERHAFRALTRKNLRKLDDNHRDEPERVNTAKSSSEDTSTSILIPILNSDDSAQDDDSIKSLCGKSVQEQNIEEWDSQEHERAQPLVFFSRRPSYDGSLNSHSHPITRRFSSAMMRPDSKNLERSQSDESTGQVDLYLQRKKDSDIKRSLIKFSSKNQTPSEPITASKSFWEWRWVMSSSLVILATLLYLLKVKMSKTHPQSNKIRRKKRNRIS